MEGCGLHTKWAGDDHCIKPTEVPHRRNRAYERSAAATYPTRVVKKLPGAFRDPTRVASSLLTALFDDSAVTSDLPRARFFAGLVVDPQSGALRNPRCVARGSRQLFSTRASFRKAPGSFFRRRLRREKLPGAFFRTQLRIGCVDRGRVQRDTSLLTLRRYLYVSVQCDRRFWPSASIS